MNKEEHPMKESTRMKTRETMVAVALCALAGASAFGAIETLTVSQGETAVRDTTYRWYTNTALTVSGTLDFSVVGPYVLCAVAADGTYDADGKKKPTMQLAPHSGDEGVLNITNGTALGTQVGVTFGSHLTVGAQGGGAQARINIGVDGTTKASSYRLDTLLLHAGAQTAADEFRLVTIGYKAALELLKLQNDTAKPLVVAFTNDVADAPASDPALLRQFYTSSPFAPSKQAGGDIVLRGEPRSPIRLDSWGTTPWNFFGNTASKANLVTEGACDFIVQCPERGVTLNLTNVVWRHAGDTVLKPKSDGASFCVQHPHVLPWGAQTGVVKVRTDTKKGTAVTLNLNGHDQKVNGLVVEAPSRIANVADNGAPAQPATLTFGAGNTDGVLVGAVEDGTISCVKEGAGALTLSNATVRALTVTNGVLKVFPGTVNRIGTLVLTNAALEVALDAQLEVETFVHDDALVDAVAIRAKATNEMTVATRALYPFTKIEKTGAAFHTMTLPPRANGAALHVKEGVLRLGGSACTNAWWRFIAKKASIEKRTDTWNGKTLVSTLFLGSLGLFTPSGLPSLGVTGAHGADDPPDAAALAPGWVASRNRWTVWSPDRGKAYFGMDHDPVLTGGGAYSPLAFLQCYGDDGTNHYDGTREEDRVTYWYGTVMFTNRVLKADDAATWETVYWRARDAARQPVTCYALRRGVNMTAKDYPCPSDWELQTSPDGVVWTTLDARAGERAWEEGDAGSTKLNAQYSFTYNNHIPYLFRALRADWKFLDFGAVRVDAGATLDVEELDEANIAFNRLAVDCAGAGTITTFRPAANGSLDVTTVAGTGPKGLPRRLTLPLTFGRLVAAENLASWTVYVDGERSFASAVGVDGGRLAVTTANGTVLILR